PEMSNLLYGFVHLPEQINQVAFGFLDLSVKNPILALISGAFQFFQMKRTMKNSAAGNDQAALMSKQMMYFMPIIITIVAFNLPAGLVLYWTVNTIFSILEYSFVHKK
ncbi:MAG: YidC/Oxa1 family membrane protein insertase, partial [Salegentibacter mishustinae]|nr:YidC/Oxa1 family membrane protein insertase [Salegentibacter mishustinae]